MAAVGLAVPAVDRQSCTYTACYCEENVYRLLERLIKQERKPSGHLYAMFISNRSETVPFWQQRASQRADKLVIWDYHVVVLEVNSHVAGPGDMHVWDLDTLLPFPCTLEQYAEDALQVHTMVLPPHFQRCYRIVSADLFLQRFASDRSHMLLADGSWSATPPSYACIVAQDGCTNNLRCYRDMTMDTYNVGESRNLDTTATGRSVNCAASSSEQQHPAGQGCGDCRCDSQGATEQASWQLISTLSTNQQYGVVVTEQQLLSALGL